METTLEHPSRSSRSGSRKRQATWKWKQIPGREVQLCELLNDWIMIMIRPNYNWMDTKEICKVIISLNYFIEIQETISKRVMTRLDPSLSKDIANQK
jgi:F0F1-type ATP synthase membrane subunit a